MVPIKFGLKILSGWRFYLIIGLARRRKSKDED